MLRNAEGQWSLPKLKYQKLLNILLKFPYNANLETIIIIKERIQ